MNVKSACLVGLVMTLAGVSTARAQYANPMGNPAGTSASPSLLPAASVPGTLSLPADGVPPPSPVDGSLSPTPAGPKLSDWILGGRTADCCGQVGGSAPIGTELYLRWGLSLPVGGGFFSHTLSTGWTVQGGWRTLFFDQPGDAAWVVDLGLSDTSHHGQHDDSKAALHNIILPNALGTNVQVPRVLVTTRHLNRTFLNLGGGREWYLSGSGLKPCGGDCAANEGTMCRVGVDVGGRWGSAKLELNEIKHRTEVLGGVYLAVHSDLEIPWGCCLFVVGARVEWDYIWSDILQRSVDTDLQNVNLLMTLGVRF